MSSNLNFKETHCDKLSQNLESYPDDFSQK